MRSVVAIGLGLGGLLAYRAVSLGAPIDGLALWAAPARGREFIRRLTALSRLESSGFFKDLPEPPPRPDGQLEAGGFLLDAQTVSDLTALDVTTLDLPRGLPRGALLLQRDGIAVDARLRPTYWSASGWRSPAPTAMATPHSHRNRTRARCPSRS